MRIASVGHLRMQVMQPMHFSLSRTTVFSVTGIKKYPHPPEACGDGRADKPSEIYPQIHRRADAHL